MILVLAFAAWSLLLAVVGLFTGIAALTFVATGIGALAVGSTLVVLVAAAHSPEPITSRSRIQAGRAVLAAP